MDFSSPSNKPLSIIIKEENVPPKAMATAHILIELATFSIVLRGGLLVIIAPIPANTLPPTTTPKAIQKFCTILI